MPRAVVFRGLAWMAGLLLLFNSGCTALSDRLAASASSAGDLKPSSISTQTPKAVALVTRPTAQSSLSPPLRIQETPASTPTRISAFQASITATARDQPQGLSRDLLLELGFDVLYLRQGSLHRWSHVSRQVDILFGPSMPGSSSDFRVESEIYPGEVVDFATDRQQRRVVVLINRGISANGVGLYDLALFDLERGAARSLLEEVPRLERLALSPDGSLLVYNDATNRQLYLLSLEQESLPQALADCQSKVDGDCTPAWSFSAKYLAWADAHGIWQASAPDWRASLASPVVLSMLDIDGNQRDVQVQAGRLNWAPFDRYILAEIFPQIGEQHWLAVVDMRTGIAEEIPGPTFSAGSELPAAWLSDGTLITLHHQPASIGGVRANYWQLFPTRKPMPMLQRSLEVDLAASVLADLRVIANRFLLFRAQDQDNTTGWLARLDLQFEQLNWVLPTPGGVHQASWTPDGTGVFLEVEPDISLFASTGGAQLTDVRNWFGNDLSSLTWCLATGKTGQGSSE